MTHALNRESLIESLFENMNAVKRGLSSHWQQLNRDCPVSRSQLELLFAIRHAQPVSFKHLAQQLYLTPGAVSQLAEGLESHELIERHADAADRRVQSLRVSAKGRKLLQTIEKRHRQLIETVIDGLTDEEMATWLRVQEKMLHHFQHGLTDTKQEKETK